jgi:hypothetical protein
MFDAEIAQINAGGDIWRFGLQKYFYHRRSRQERNHIWPGKRTFDGFSHASLSGI